MLMIDAPIEVRGKRVLQESSDVARIRAGLDLYPLRVDEGPEPRGLAVARTWVIMREAAYEIGMARLVPPEPPEFFSRSAPASEDERAAFNAAMSLPGLPVRWAFKAFGSWPRVSYEPILAVDFDKWSSAHCRGRVQDPPAETIDESLVQVISGSVVVADEWVHTTVDISSEGRIRRRDIIDPGSSIPLIFALRRWHLSRPLLTIAWPSNSGG